MATKMKSKGTVLAVSIATVYTAIPLIQTISRSEEKTETYDSRTLDQTNPGLTFDQTGYASPPKFTAKLFYDAANSVHAALKALARTPVAATPFNTNFKMTYTDAGPVAETWAVPGVGWSEEVDGTKGVMATLTLEASGTVS